MMVLKINGGGFMATGRDGTSVNVRETADGIQMVVGPGNYLTIGVGDLLKFAGAFEALAADIEAQAEEAMEAERRK